MTGVWAGLRPLLAPPARAPSARSARPTSPGATPCATSPHGVVTVTGGKLTTYRKMAEDTVAEVVAAPGRRTAARRRPCVTKRRSGSAARPGRPGTGVASGRRPAGDRPL